MNLDVITHYYLIDKQPFLSLSDLDGDTNSPTFKEMLNRHKFDPQYNRRFGLNYLETRKRVEEQLRDLFIKRGGNPSREYPIYFVLGESKWFKNLNEKHIEIQIPISELPRDKVSITFPDSYLTMTACDKPYYKKVHLINEVDEIISKYGLPDDAVPETYEKYWEGDFEHYFEVQIWDDNILKKYE